MSLLKPSIGHALRRQRNLEELFIEWDQMPFFDVIQEMEEMGILHDWAAMNRSVARYLHDRINKKTIDAEGQLHRARIAACMGRFARFPFATKSNTTRNYPDYGNGASYYARAMGTWHVMANRGLQIAEPCAQEFGDRMDIIGTEIVTHHHVDDEMIDLDSPFMRNVQKNSIRKVAELLQGKQNV